MSDDEPKLKLLPVVHEICRAHWRTKPVRGADGKVRDYPAKDCCNRCPIMGACHAPAPTTGKGIDDHRRGLNEAATAHRKGT